jgi:hypothetical protein
MNYQEILDRYVGKEVEAEDASNKDQCMDWAFKYCDEIGVDRAAIRHLHAYQAFTQPNDLTLKYFDYIPNTPNGVPQLGDIIIFGTGVGIAGHIAVVQSADTHNIKSLDQNWNGHHFCEYINHPYDNVLGWLRPKSQQTSPISLHPVKDVNITDQTKIDLGPTLGVFEVQAIRSTIIDQSKTMLSQLTEIEVLDERLETKTEQLKKLQADLDEVRTEVEELENTSKTASTAKTTAVPTDVTFEEINYTSPLANFIINTAYKIADWLEKVRVGNDQKGTS